MYDVIGDIHGQGGKLRALLAKLGYAERAGHWRAPQGRMAVFVGDLIDRGPEQVSSTATRVVAANGGGARAESKVVPTVADMVAQTDLTLDPSIAMVPRTFAGHSRGAKRIGEELRPVAQCAYDETNKLSSKMFGEVAPAKRSDGLGKLDERSSAKDLEVPGGQQPVRGDLRAPAPDAAAADGGPTQAGRPAEAGQSAAQAADLAPTPTAGLFPSVRMLRCEMTHRDWNMQYSTTKGSSFIG